MLLDVPTAGGSKDPHWPGEADWPARYLGCATPEHKSAQVINSVKSRFTFESERMSRSVRAMRLPAACPQSPCSSATLRCNFPAHCSREISCETRANASFLTHSGASADGETALIPCRFACYGKSKRHICKPYWRPEPQRIRAIWSRISPPVTLSAVAFADGNAAELRRFRRHSLIRFCTERLGGGAGVRITYLRRRSPRYEKRLITVPFSLGAFAIDR
jgi:hypothetical protein